MRLLTASIVAHEPAAAGLTCLRLASPALGAAGLGQWVAIRQPETLHIAAQPFPLTATNARDNTADLLYGDREWLSPWLATRPVGSMIELLGPWGRPITIDALARHIVLLAREDRLTRLLALGRALVERGVAVVVLHDAASASGLLSPSLLLAAVEYQVATADGSVGTTGSVLDLLAPLLSWADALYAALPHELYLPLRDLVHRGRLRARRRFVTVVADAPLACYAAACDGCVIPLRDRYGLLCKDGPAFDLLDLA